MTVEVTAIEKFVSQGVKEILSAMRESSSVGNPKPISAKEWEYFLLTMEYMSKIDKTLIFRESAIGEVYIQHDGLILKIKPTIAGGLVMIECDIKTVAELESEEAALKARFDAIYNWGVVPTQTTT